MTGPGNAPLIYLAWLSKMPDFPVTNGVTTFIAPPPGATVDFAHPRERFVLAHYVVFCVGGPLAFIALLQRYYTKAFLSEGLQVDDGFMFLAWVSSLVTQSMLMYLVGQGGVCAHAWEMPLSRYQTYLVIVYVTAPTFTLCNGFTKLSLLTFYRRISPQPKFRIVVWVGIGVVVVYTTIFTLLFLFRCNPVSKGFDVTLDGGACVNADVLYMSTAVSTIVTDVMLFALPMPMIVALHLGWAQKTCAIVIITIGSLTLATSAIRLALLPAILKSEDTPWTAAPADVWTFVECNLLVICGSLPTLRKFFNHFAPRFVGSSRSDHSNSGPSACAGTGPGARARSGRSRSRSGGRRKHQLYEQYPDDNEMQAYGYKEASACGGDHDGPGAKAAVAISSCSPRHDRDDDGDGGSDKAILKTKTFVIQYNKADVASLPKL